MLLFSFNFLPLSADLCLHKLNVETAVVLAIPNSVKISASSSSISMSRISPILLLVIVILAVIFFLFGLFHLLVRYLMKRPSFSSVSQSNRFPETTSGSQALQRQLQQLFRLHDSGLDQAIIDNLPLFLYKDIMGLKEPFDCAVCLCEFSGDDKLRLLPLCSHAFHIHCIDTWLLSNSTCPLCRGVISSSAHPNLVLAPEEWRRRWSRPSSGIHNKTQIMQENNGGDMRVFSVRLGKFRNLNLQGQGGSGSGERGGDEEKESSSRCNIDARRCFSMGSFQYVVGDSDLQVALPSIISNGGATKVVNVEGPSGGSSSLEGKKISARTEGESFSVSKIWLWSKKDNYKFSSHNPLALANH
ncbi:RING-H2 finger protein ATL47-like isoform X1 [Ipomoea triloba]|uniref:RING-H2 finger protein ATL47-like isoform X1 n=2 Tax=Ipomoea triloba TaxID=35885 RepID=UPI00125DE5D4|nr:RING-H2 finger protein ATL47-like isoform X1 [Ipomoea triloba]XP_031118409.1 RING-H2 finger protein ATL47-like isoform X1 [Ipomoea triloba]